MDSGWAFFTERFIRVRSRRDRDDVKKDGKEMERAAGQDEEMPYGMVVRHTVPAIEYQTQDIGEPSGDEKNQAAHCDGGDQGFEGNDDEEPHPHVEGDRGDRPAAKQGDLKDDAEQGDRPDDGEEGPTPRAAEVYQQEGGIGSGDQQKDGRMVENPQDGFCLGDLDAVVEGRGGVKHDQRGPEDAAAYDVPCVSEERRKRGQYPERPDRQDGADPVGDAVGQLFPGAVPGDSYT